MWRLVLLLLVPTALSAEGPEVKLGHGGALRGTYQTTLKGRKIAAFLGVPYAKTPARFQLGEPVEDWEGIREAIKVKDDCLQYSQLTFRTHGSEDCLYANIYTPEDFRETSKLHDVVIYIHGGGFSYMLGHYGPKYILDHDVVMVSFTYRVGPLGFLSTGDRVLPGNLGLKDQWRLLQWVSKNIRYFGGNPDRVLLSGTSAGGASVHYHMLSPLSRGLFHRAFSMSGTSLCCWTQTEKSNEKAVFIGKRLGCPTNSSYDLVNCLSNKDGKDIVDQMRNLQKWVYYPFTPLGPVVEPDSAMAFISKYPSEIIRDGEALDIPWLATLTTEEGLYPLADFIANVSYVNELDERWNDLLPSLLDYEHTTTTISKDTISHKVREKYIGKSPVRESLQGLTDMCSDRLFVDGVVRAAKSHAALYKSPVYTYLFSYRGKHSCSERVSNSTKNFGVSHGDDTAYIFQNELMNPEDSEKDRKMIEVLTKLVVEFAATGKPFLNGITDWPKLSSKHDFSYVNIKDPETFQIVSNPNLGQSEFWKSFKLSED